MALRKSPFIPEDSVAEFMLRILDDFTASKKLAINPAIRTAFLAKLENLNTPEDYGTLRSHHEGTNFADCKSLLFLEELLISTSVEGRTGRLINTFDRGRREAAMLSGRSVSIYERNKSKIDGVAAEFKALIFDELDALKPDVCVEVGSAWCATVDFIMTNFKPSTYYVFEIDEVYADYARERYGCIAKDCDGETFGDIGDNSVDFVVSNSVYFFMPPIKQYSYMRETARVLRPGGKSFFNIASADRRTADKLDRMLRDHFPRRAFGLFPEAWLALAFPKDQFEVKVLIDHEAPAFLVTKRG